MTTLTTSVLRFGELAVAQLWQVTLLAVVVGLVVRLGCRHRPHLAYLLWMIVVLKCLTPPLVSSHTSPFSWLRQATAAQDADTSPQREPLTRLAARQNLDEVPSDQVTNERLSTALGNPEASAIVWGNASRHLLIVLTALWLVGVGLLSLRIGFKSLALKRLCRAAIDPPAMLQEQLHQLAGRLNIRRRVHLVVVREQVRPAVFGVFRPSILLPATLIENASAETLEPILAHELIHVRRSDPAASTLQLAAQVTWWFHPLVWWANREARRERERACDEEVVSALEYSPTRYARMLLELLASFTEPQRIIVPGSVTMLGFTARRLEHLVGGKARFHRRTPRRYWLIGVVALVIVLPGAGLKWPRSSTVVAMADETQPAKPRPSKEPKRQDKRDWTEAVVPVDGDTESEPTGTFIPNRLPVLTPESTEADTEAHRLAVAEIKKLGGFVQRQQEADGKQPLTVVIRDTPESDKILAKLKDLTELTTVVLENCERVTTDGFAMLKELSSVNLLALTQVSDEQIGRLKGWDRLVHLQLTSDRLSDTGLASVATMPRLSELYVGRRSFREKNTAHAITDAGIASLSALKELKRLSVYSGVDVTGTGLRELARLPKLSELYLLTPSINAEGFAAAATLPHLKVFSISTSDLPPAAFAPLEKMTSLERLSLYDDKAPLDDSVAAYLAKLTELRELGLFDTKLTDAGLAHLRGLTNLRSLLISKGIFTDVGLGYLKSLRELRKLSLSAELDASDEGIKNLAGMVHLTELQLPGKRITDEGLIALAKMTDLRSLNLEKSQIQGPGLEHVRGLAKLRKLDLGKTLIGDAELPRLAQFPALEDLNLQVTSVSDTGMESLGKLTNLKTLMLTSTKVTDAGLDQLAGLKKLQILHVEGTEVTKEGQERLKKLLPSLNINLSGNAFISFEPAE